MARWISVLVLVGACLALPIHAGPVVAKPEDVGLSSDRLARVHDAVQRHIDAKAISGAVTLVARNGRIAHLEAHGLIDIESKRPMPKDGIFRFASMSKPITAVAVMMLLEEGKIHLSDPDHTDADEHASTAARRRERDRSSHHQVTDCAISSRFDVHVRCT